MSNEVEQRVLTMTDKRNLEKELEELRQAKLDVAEEIKIARGHGDLSENAEYDEAKNNEARIYTSPKWRTRSRPPCSSTTARCPPTPWPSATPSRSTIWNLTRKILTRW